MHFAKNSLFLQQWKLKNYFPILGENDYFENQFI